MIRRRKKTQRQPRFVPSGTEGKLKAAGTQWPVRVADRDEDSIMLVLLAEAVDLSRQHAGPLTLECKSERGVVRFHGEVTVENRDLVRFRVVGLPDMVQRREFVRVRAPQAVLIAFPDDSGIGSAHSLDISGGGMLLHGAERLQIGDHIRFHLHLDAHSPPVRGRGKVVRSAEGGRRGVVFEQIAKDDQERLIHFIFACQRADRAKTRGDDL
jgi:c-di-GMP-binding flagellar brake protein YcgR